jgi:hypothetical protein
MALPIKEVLDRILSSSDGWQSKLVKNWKACVGPLHEQIRLERIYKDTVVLGVYNVHWMQELYLLSRTILYGINHMLGGQHVNHLKFQLVARSISTRKRQRIALPLDYPCHQITHKENRALEQIKDPELKKLLYAYLLKISREKPHE